MANTERKRGYVLYRDWTPVICMLSDEEAGQLLKAIAKYQEGEHSDLKGMTQGIFMMMRETFDRDAEKYSETCEKRREAGRKGGRPQKADIKANESKKSKRFLEEPKKAEYEYEYEQEQEKEQEQVQEIVQACSISEPVKEIAIKWIRYREEIGAPLKRIAVETLIEEMSKREREKGALYIINAVNASISNGYRGIVWDKIGNNNTNINCSQTMSATDMAELAAQMDAEGTYIYDFGNVEKSQN